MRTEATEEVASDGEQGSDASSGSSDRPVKAAISRARPRWFMQSGRFPVTSTSRMASSPNGSIPSTASPAAVSRRDSSAGGRSIATWSRSQSRENLK